MNVVRNDTLRIQFTDARVEALKATNGVVKVYDREVKMLGLRVLTTGRKHFFWFKRVPLEEQPDESKPVWKMIGEYPSVSIDKARTAAKKFDVMLADWKLAGCHRPSPFEVAERRGEMTLTELLEDYFAKHLRATAHHPEVAERDANYRFNAHLKSFAQRRISTISRIEMRELHAKIGASTGQYQANAVVELVRRLYNFAIKQEIFAGVNPAASVERFHEKKRKRFVLRDEMPKLFAALKTEKNKDLVAFVQLSLWTGARKGDIFAMRWQDLALEDNRWLVPDPKGGESYQVALTNEAVAILEKRKNKSVYVFPGFGKSGHITDLKKRWGELLKRAGLNGLRQHDLRRTLGSWQAAQGTSVLVIGKSLGHRSTHATMIYSQLNLDDVRPSVEQAAAAMITASKKKQKRLPAASGK